MTGNRKQEKNYTRLVKHRLEEKELHKEVYTVKCTFMYGIYGIVKVEKSSNNKGL